MTTPNDNPVTTEAEILEKTIRAAASILCKTALDLIEKDPHQWSSRPCATCQTVTNLIGRPFGCSAYTKLYAQR